MPAIPIDSRVEGLALHLWSVEEPLEWFLKEVQLTSQEDLEFEAMLGKRRLEYIVQRYLLSHYLNGAKPLLRKTPNGKPYIANRQEKISITHSRSMLMLSTARTDHGIDLEWIDERINRLAGKFCNDMELKVPGYTDPAFWYTLVWSCKEALYKVDGLGQLEFRTQLAVHFTPPSFKERWGRGIVRRDDKTFFFRLYFEEINGFIVTWAFPAF